jgi:hypothetical protein
VGATSEEMFALKSVRLNARISQQNRFFREPGFGEKNISLQKISDIFSPERLRRKK